MKVLITGGGGFVGGKLARRLASDGTLDGQRITELILTDIIEPALPNASFEVRAITADLANPEIAPALLSDGVDVIYHLACVASGGSEADFDLGMAANLHATLNLFQAARQLGTCPKVIFTSSVAVHGGDCPDPVPDGVELNPQTSYGAQKAMAELLLNDMSRRGFLDGRGLRLPTVSIRPGRPNTAASSFMSGIFREPLQGEPSNCPVPPDFPIWHTAPRTVVANLIHAASVPAADFGYNRCFNLPGRTDTIGEMIAAMTRVAGPDPETRITWDRDPKVEKIVHGWRNRFEPNKGLGLGFTPDESFENSVRWFLEDDHRDRAA